MSDATLDRLRPQRFGILLGLLALLFGFGFGIVFGAAEDSLKQGLKDGAAEVLVEHYGGDEAKAKAVVDKSFTYYKRAHLHAGGLGAAALVLLVLLAFACPPTTLARAAGVMVGFGAVGYPIFWMLAGSAAPGLGGTGAAKASLEWLALPTAGAMVFGTALAAVLITRALFARSAPTPTV